MANILIVEDDRGINELIRRTLAAAGHTGLPAYSGQEALKSVAERLPDLILLDIGLPDMDGFRLMKQLGEIPVLCVTARDEVSDRVRGLMGGAEDYIVKPFALEELLARIEVALRRRKKEQTLWRIKTVEIDLERAIVTRDGRRVELTSQEYELLKVLLEHRNMALSREKLLELAWDMGYPGDDRTVDVHISRLRQKLGWEKVIRTVYKYGYRLEI